MPVNPNKRNVLIDRDALRPYFGARNAQRGPSSLIETQAANIGDLQNASYITVNAEAFLNAERQLVAGTGIASVDGGVNSTFTLNTGEGPGIDITANAVGLGGDTILLFDNGGSPVAEHAATNAGFAAAIAAAGAGDLIQLPLALTLSAAHEVPAGVTVRGPCVITASGDYTALITTNSTSVLEDFEIDYTTTSTSGNIAAIYGAEIGTLRRIKATVTNSTHAAGTYGLKANNVADGTRIHDCYFNVVGNVTGGTRIGIYIITPAGSDGRNISITNVIGRGHCNASGSTCYGIHIEGTQRRTILDGCIGFGHAQWADGTSYGIYTQNALLTGCVGETGDTGTGYGIYCDSGRLFGCHGYGATTGAGTAAGIYLGDEGYAYDCRAEVVTTGGTEYGFYCAGANTYIYGGQCEGHETDLYINSGICNTCGLQYETTAGAGTLNNELMTGLIPITGLTSYARGSIIRGGASGWEAYSANTNGAALIGNGTDVVCDLTPTWQSSHTFADGLIISAAKAITMGDASWLGIASNELLTVNAAGNFTFSGVTSVVVPDGCWVGADANCAWVFDTTSSTVSTLDRVSIGTAVGGATLEVQRTGAGSVFLAQTDQTDGQSVFNLLNGDAQSVFRAYANHYVTVGNSAFIFNTDGTMVITGLGGSGNDDLYVDNTGKLINDPSDAKFKTHIEPLDSVDALTAILGLRGCYFDWGEASKEIGDLGTRRQVGLIAQEVEPYIPLAVTDVRGEYKSVSTKKIIPFLVEAIKAQQVRIEALEAR